MSLQTPILNSGYFQPLSGQGLFGGIRSATSNMASKTGGMETQYSLALQEVQGQTSAAKGFAQNTRIGHPLFSTANNPRHSIVPLSLLPDSSSPWTEGARLALGENGAADTIIPSIGWRAARNGSSVAQSSTRQTNSVEKFKAWIKKSLPDGFNPDRYPAWKTNLLGRFEKLNPEEKIRMGHFLVTYQPTRMEFDGSLVSHHRLVPDIEKRHFIISGFGDIIQECRDEELQQVLTEIFSEMLYDDVSSLRENTVEMLGMIARKLKNEDLQYRFAQMFSETLIDEASDVRRAGVNALGNLIPELYLGWGVHLTESLAEMLQDRDSSVRYFTVRALGSIILRFEKPEILHLRHQYAKMISQLRDDKEHDIKSAVVEFMRQLRAKKRDEQKSLVANLMPRKKRPIAMMGGHEK